MTNESEEKLEALLKEWFGIVDFDKPHFFTRNPVAKLLKRELERRARWKSKSKRRGAADHLKQWRFGK